MSVEQRSLTMEKQTASFADMSPPRRLTTTPTQKNAYTLSAPPQLPARHVPTSSSTDADFSPIKERRSFSSSTKVEASSFGAKLSACFRGMFLCCTGCDGDEGASSDSSSGGGGAGARRKGSAKTMIISAPTNFRREEIHIAGLTPEQEHLIRQKASSDAQRQWTSLSPLRSLPPESFAERPVKPKISSPTQLTSPNSTDDNKTMTLSPTYEEFTQPRSAPSTPSPTVGGPTKEGTARLREKMRTQSRRGSGNFVPGKRTSGNFSGARIFATGDGAGRSVSGGGSGNVQGRAVSGGSEGLGLTGVGRGAGEVTNFALPRTPPPLARERVEEEEFPLQGREGRM
ncbi:unnamed protein product [Zymoseptoria tritici ST99CH_1A5]|uniref:Uncharacterized protein n=1 Tax=Zymoseptoria tritici ST99CH_1A5 TaxID=1276529 RepID=A0A1Y6LSN2_ZYMTR|nr:unnamed protein product [Zymoseptoria tritici ST99CH_1A5]